MSTASNAEAHPCVALTSDVGALMGSTEAEGGVTCSDMEEAVYHRMAGEEIVAGPEELLMEKVAEVPYVPGVGNN